MLNLIKPFVFDHNETGVRSRETEAEYYSDQSKCRVVGEEIKMASVS